MSRYRVPDHLVCLGNGGNEIGETFMDQEWILSEVLKDNPRAEVDAPDETQNPLHAFFIDTDESTLPSDLESRIDTTVNRIAR